MVTENIAQNTREKEKNTYRGLGLAVASRNGTWGGDRPAGSRPEGLRWPLRLPLRT